MSEVDELKAIIISLVSKEPWVMQGVEDKYRNQLAVIENILRNMEIEIERGASLRREIFERLTALEKLNEKSR